MTRDRVNRTASREALRQALQTGQQISQKASSGQGFDPRGGVGVLAAQLATAGIGAFAQNRAKKQLAELEQQEQQAFATQFPQFAGLAAQTTPETRQAAIQAQLGGQIKDQFKEPKKDKFSIQKTDSGIFRINERTGAATQIKIDDKPIGVKPVKKDDKKPLSAETSKVLTIATGGIKAINELDNILGEGGTVSIRSELAPERLKTPRGRKITLLRKDLADSIGRLRSGGAINEEELKTFKSFIPSRTDDAETTQFKMRKLGEKFATLQAGITGQEIPVEKLTLDQEPSKGKIKFLGFE